MNILRPLFCYYRARFVIYLYAIFINVEKVSEFLRKVSVGRYFLRYVEKCSNNVPVYSLS